MAGSKILTWWEVAERINMMPLDERAKPALTQDDNTGEYVGFTELVDADPETPAYLNMSSHAYETGQEKGPVGDGYGEADGDEIPT